ncbi:MAG: hypothetical protein RBS49_10325, partial [Sphaerochaeta sp.]|nr:hypothetical protein [Sphaerochaeta sp.]
TLDVILQVLLTADELCIDTGENVFESHGRSIAWKDGAFPVGARLFCLSKKRARSYTGSIGGGE